MVDLHSLQRRTVTLDRSVVLSLQILQFPLGELGEYLQTITEKNPMLQVSLQGEKFVTFDEIPKEPWVEEFSWGEETFWNFSSSWYQEQMSGWSREEKPPLSAVYQEKNKGFSKKLVEQLRLSTQVSPDLLPHCIFLAESLDRNGYYTEDLYETTELLGIDLDVGEEALYLLQEMQPTGVGARDLHECLLLQLVKSPYFGEDTLEMVAQGADFFEGLDFKKMAETLGKPVSEVTATWQKIRGFHPIPTSRHFKEVKEVEKVVPEAIVTVNRGKLEVAFQHEGQVFATINPELVENLKNERNTILASYQQENLDTCREMLSAIEQRNEILEEIIIFLTAYQKDYFTSKKKGDLKHLLKPLEMGKLADLLELHPTLVSRGICDKYIATPRGLISLQSLLSPPNHEEEVIAGEDCEEDLEKRGKVFSRLRMIIDGEDKSKPLSDEKMKALLEGLSIHIARRTVAKYRTILKIPNASKRKIRK